MIIWQHCQVARVAKTRQSLPLASACSLQGDPLRAGGVGASEPSPPSQAGKSDGEGLRAAVVPALKRARLQAPEICWLNFDRRVSAEEASRCAIFAIA